MYTPSDFARRDPAELRAFVQAHSFAVLCTAAADGELAATHLPVLYQAGAPEYFLGHLARANPQGRLNGAAGLLIFSGPHGFISPTWYAAPHTVPTWNYEAVHVTGRLEFFDAAADLMALVEQLTAVYEAARTPPWRPDWSDPALRKMLSAIVGFRLHVTRWEGKAKLSQNQPLERRERVIAALEAQAQAGPAGSAHPGDPASADLAAAMRRALPGGANRSPGPAGPEHPA
ncbi:MAG: FMN-binding negative transcriptional regulator [Planctomycetota bacterium]